MAIKTIAESDRLSDSRSDLNGNFAALEQDKATKAEVAEKVDAAFVNDAIAAQDHGAEEPTASRVVKRTVDADVRGRYFRSSGDPATDTAADSAVLQYGDTQKPVSKDTFKEWIGVGTNKGALMPVGAFGIGRMVDFRSYTIPGTSILYQDAKPNDLWLARSGYVCGFAQNSAIGLPAGTYSFLEICFGYSDNSGNQACFRRATSSGVEYISKVVDANTWGAWTPTTAGPWQRPTYGSGWSDYSSGYIVRFRHINGGKSVEMKGVVKASSNFGGIVFTLPAGYRPVEGATRIPVTAANNTCRLLIYPTGNIVVRVDGDAALSGNPGWVHFNCVFPCS